MSDPNAPETTTSFWQRHPIVKWGLIGLAIVAGLVFVIGLVLVGLAVGLPLLGIILALIALLVTILLGKVMWKIAKWGLWMVSKWIIIPAVFVLGLTWGAYRAYQALTSSDTAEITTSESAEQSPIVSAAPAPAVPVMVRTPSQYQIKGEHVREWLGGGKVRIDGVVYSYVPTAAPATGEVEVPLTLAQ